MSSPSTCAVTGVILDAFGNVLTGATISVYAPTPFWHDTGNFISGTLDSTTSGIVNSTFTCTAANATAGAVYSNNGVNFTVTTTIASNSVLSCTSTGLPAASGTLTKVSGTGDTTITFSAVSSYNWSVNAIETASCSQKLTFEIKYFDGISGQRKKDYAVIVPNQTTATLYSLIGTTSGSPVTPLGAQYGGTGLSTLPSNAVLLGNGAGSLGSASPNTSGYVLTDNGPGNNPSFQAINLSNATGTILPANGGTGVNSSSSGGVAVVSGGSWSFQSQLFPQQGGTGLDTSAQTGVPSINTGVWGVNSQLPNTLGGTGQNSSAWTGLVKTSSGTWSSGNLSGDVTSSGLVTTLAATSNSTLTTLSALASVGTLTTGTWHATAIGAQYGGTGINTASSTGVPSISAGTWSTSATLPISLGGTGQATQQAALNALAPSSPSNGQVISYNGTNWVASTPAAGTKNYLTALQTSNGTNTGNGNFEFGTLTGWNWCTVGTLTNGLPTGTPTFTSTTNTLYTFTVSSANATAGATYTNNSQTFTVVNTISSGTTLVCTGTGAPGSSGTLTKATGTGDSSITFSASSNLAASTVSSGQLSGSCSASLASSGATVAGQGFVSNAFYIDTEDQAKVLTVKFYYNASSGASNANWSGTSNNSFAWAVYDVTNSTWLGTAGQFGMTQSSGTGYCTGTFQTASNTTQLRFVVYNANATSGAATVYLDDFFVGPQTAPMGPAMTDWGTIAWTPTGNWSTNTSYSGYWRRIGDTLEGNVLVTLSGAPTGTFKLNMPSGLTIDTTKLNTSGISATVGVATAIHSSTYYTGNIVESTSTTLAIVTTSGSSAWNATTPTTWASGDTISLYFVVPIVGWSSNTSMSSDTDTRVVAMRANTSTTTIGTSDTQLVFSAVEYDTHGAYSNTTGAYTVPVTGYYKVSSYVFYSTGVSSSSAGPTLQMKVNVNGVAKGLGQFLYQVAATQYPTIAGSTTVYAQAGQSIYVTLARSSSNISSFNLDNTATDNWLSIERVSGPAVVAATESVNARYTFAGNGAIPTATVENLTSTYATYTKLRDTHNAFNTSTGVFTAPVSGMYRASIRITLSPSTTNTGELLSLIQQGGSATTLSQSGLPFGTVSAYTSGTTDSFPMLAGDTLTFQGYQSNGSSIAASATVAYNSISIERVGN